MLRETSASNILLIGELPIDCVAMKGRIRRMYVTRVK